MADACSLCRSLDMCTHLETSCGGRASRSPGCSDAGPSTSRRRPPEIGAVVELAAPAQFDGVAEAILGDLPGLSRSPAILTFSCHESQQSRLAAPPDAPWRRSSWRGNPWWTARPRPQKLSVAPHLGAASACAAALTLGYQLLWTVAKGVDAILLWLADMPSCYSRQRLYGCRFPASLLGIAS